MTIGRTPAYSYVRMSTETQLKGDSLRRQLDLSRKYAAENQLDLIESFDLADIGISAFTGENAASGALGRFLEAVREGKVAKGAYLLVESLDRLSRQEPQRALTLFLQIVNSGIVLVTLGDGRKYTPTSVKMEDLIYSIAVLSRAHEESAMKSRRVSAAWKNKRENIRHRKLTARCPAWLSLSSDRRMFEKNKDRVAIVRRIFAETNSGLGAYSIARRLNSERVPSFTGRSGWHVSSVNKIVTNRAVIGEFQPHKLVDGRRVPDGEAISDYFPAIIELDTYYSAQASRVNRRIAGGGRKGKSFSNLFSKIAYCRYCGGKMHFENKGGGIRGGAYLVCDNAKRAMGCTGTRWRYQDFEASFLAFVEELDIGSIFTEREHENERSIVEQRMQAVAGQILGLEQERENVYELLRQPGMNTAFIAEKLASCERQLNALHADQRELSSTLSMQMLTVNTLKNQPEKIRELIKRLADATADEGFTDRAQIAARLSSVLTRVSVASAGDVPLKDDILAYLESLKPDADAAERKRLNEYLESDDSNLSARYFVAVFKNGTSRAIYPHRDDPLQFSQQLYSGDPNGAIERISPSGERIAVNYPLPNRASGGL